MRRREFITLAGGAAVWPIAAQAQRPGVASVGFMHSLSPEVTDHVVAAFHRGLAEAGYIEGSNVSIEYRWARGHFEHQCMPLNWSRCAWRSSSRQEARFSALAAKAATSVIPIVFTSGDDPLKVGLVEHLNRPSGNS